MAARCSRAMAAGSEFGALLRRHRLAAELTQAALAERALLSTRGVQHLEAGLGQPYPDTVRRLSDALGLAPDDAAHFEVAARTRPRRNMADTVGPRVPSPFVPTGEALVGRAQVRADIEQYLGAVGPPLMLLTGEPGIGKTRLLREAVARATAAGKVVMAGGCHRRGDHEPFAPVLEAIQAYLRLEDAENLPELLRGC